MRRSAILAVATIVVGVASSCAIVGFDLGGYGPAGEGGAGGASTTSSRMHATSGSGAGGAGGADSSSSSGGGGGCSPDDACFEPVAGFTGPYAFFAGAPGVACAAPWGQLAIKGGTTADETPVTCKACTCGPEPCSQSIFDFYASGACTTPVLTSGVTSTDGCKPIGPATGVTSAIARVVATNGTACTPGGGGETTHPSPAFTDESLLCSPAQPGGACGKGGICYPAPSTPFHPTICIAGPGDVGCPTDYPNAFTMYESLTDGRKCTMCTCGSPAATCSTSAIFEPNASCTGGVFTFHADGVCHSISTNSTVAGIQLTVTSPCAASGGQAAGSVTPAAKATVCCR